MRIERLIILLFGALLMTSCQDYKKSSAYSSSSGWDYSSADYGAFETAQYDQYEMMGKASFEYENNMRLDYSANDADIINKIESGNIELASLPGHSRAISDDKIGTPPDQLIIYNADVTLESKEIDSVPDMLEKIAKSHGGYLGNKSTTSVTIRVPKDNMNKLLKELVDQGKILRKRVYADDVTFQYTDLEIRLENAEKARSTYLALLEQAENVSEALLVEKELERLNTKIDLLKGQLNGLSNKIQFATVNVRIKEKTKLGPLGWIGKGIYEGVSWLFVRN